VHWEWVSRIVLVLVLIVAAVTDLRRGNVYNWLTYPAILLGFALGAVEGAAAGGVKDGLVNHVMGFGLGFGVLFVAYLFGGMGGGDVKLMAAVGALLGWPATLHAVFYSFLVGAAVGIIVVVWRGQVRVALRRLWTAVRILPLPTARLEEAAAVATFRVPFGFAVCIGTLWWMAEDFFGGSLWNAAARLVGA
jgi:prepilin peptidase CpaA